MEKSNTITVGEFTPIFGSKADLYYSWPNKVRETIIHGKTKTIIMHITSQAFLDMLWDL